VDVAQLRAVYEKALYWVEVGKDRLCFHVGLYDPVTEARLIAALGACRSWAIITPCNPASVALCEHENAARLEHFQQCLVAEDHRWLSSRNSDPEAAWPEESGALIADISMAEAIALGSDYGQYAIVYSKIGEAPQLVWLDAALKHRDPAARSPHNPG
jgi:hypothetical protein